MQLTVSPVHPGCPVCRTNLCVPMKSAPSGSSISDLFGLRDKVRNIILYLSRLINNKIIVAGRIGDTDKSAGPMALPGVVVVWSGQTIPPKHRGSPNQINISRVSSMKAVSYNFFFGGDQRVISSRWKVNYNIVRRIRRTCNK